jgi:hypothetical protein
MSTSEPLFHRPSACPEIPLQEFSGISLATETHNRSTRTQPGHFDPREIQIAGFSPDGSVVDHRLRKPVPDAFSGRAVLDGSAWAINPMYTPHLRPELYPTGGSENTIRVSINSGGLPY